MFIWLRLGDCSEYEKLDSIEEVKELFESYSLSKDFTRSHHYGIKNSEFYGNNYISLYYGDSEAQPIKTITEKELQFLTEEG